MSSPARGEPVLWRRIDVPAEYTAQTEVEGRPQRYGGDVRLGDLRGTGQADFLVYRSVDDAHDGGGMKPCFLAAFTAAGQPLWAVGDGGVQPSRPGPVAVADLDGDGHDEVLCFFLDPATSASPDSLANVVLQIRDGATGEVVRQAAPEALRACRGQGPNWVHQRLLLADFQGHGAPRDFAVKLGARVLAFGPDLELLWAHESPWTEYSHCPAYIPAVGDIDDDGRDELLGGYYLIDHDGAVLWEKPLARHMDSVAIVPFDDGRVRAVCSGFGHVLDAAGEVVLCLGEERVPHGQEVRVARFDAASEHPQMVLRHQGHTPAVLIVDGAGRELRRLELNATRNNTGMEPVFWDGPHEPARLCNGGVLWEPLAGRGAALPGLPEPQGEGRMAWYHCIAADVCGDSREEVVLYDPWSTHIYVYTPQPLDESAFAGYRGGPRQYNARLMD